MFAAAAGRHTAARRFGGYGTRVAGAHDPQVGENLQPYLALVDTGATESCIDEQVALALNLPLINKIMIGGSAGAKEHNVYLGVIAIPSLVKTVYGRFAAVDLAGGGQIHRVLLGRTFLIGTVMIYDGVRGQVTIAN